jgi:hypothetical protein
MSPRQSLQSAGVVDEDLSGSGLLADSQLGSRLAATQSGVLLTKTVVRSTVVPARNFLARRGNELLPTRDFLRAIPM